MEYNLIPCAIKSCKNSPKSNKLHVQIKVTDTCKSYWKKKHVLLVQTKFSNLFQVIIFFSFHEIIVFVNKIWYIHNMYKMVRINLWTKRIEFVIVSNYAFWYFVLIYVFVSKVISIIVVKGVKIAYVYTCVDN